MRRCCRLDDSRPGDDFVRPLGEPRRAAGVVLPVVFTGCAKGPLDEGTIYHMGVVPEQRSRGLGNLLLGRATDTLLAHGVWQISCDTSIVNAPMIRLFERHGWKRRAAIDVRGSPGPAKQVSAAQLRWRRT